MFMFCLLTGCILSRRFGTVIGRAALLYVGYLPSSRIVDQPARVGVEGVGDAALDSGHAFPRVAVHFLVVELETLFGGEGGVAARLGAPVTHERSVGAV